MASVVRLLRSTFSNVATNAPASNSTKAILQNLYNERNLKRLVEKFKHHSHSDRFRKKIDIYENTVRRLAAAKRFQSIEDILEYQKQFKHDVSKEGFTVRLITLYGRSGMFENARKVFDEMPEGGCERTVRSLNALLGACIGSRKFGEVERMFRELPEELKIKPDVVSYNTVIKGLCELGSLDKGIEMINEMAGNGVDPDVITFNTVLEALYSNGKFDDGEKVWSGMLAKNVVPDIRTYNARLLGLANEGRMKEAVELFRDLGSKNLKADVFSFGVLIKGYCKEGNLEEVKRCYRELNENECAPDKGVFWAAGSFACEKGDYDWAFELCQEIFKRKCLVDIRLLQQVVDGLVKESRISQAKQLVQMGKSNDYRRYELKLPLEE